MTIPPSPRGVHPVGVFALYALVALGQAQQPGRTSLPPIVPENQAESTSTSELPPFVKSTATANWDEAFADTRFWSELPQGDWVLESKTDAMLRYRAATPMKFLGKTPAITRVSLDAKSSEIQKIEVIWREAGLVVGSGDTSDLSRDRRTARRQLRAREKEDERMQQIAEDFHGKLQEEAKEIETTLAATYPDKTRKTIGTSAALKTRVTEHDTGKGVVIRHWDGEKSMLLATISRKENSGGDLMESEKKGRAARAAENVRRLPNNDVIIRNLPMHDQGARGYCAGATFAMILEYWGLPLPLEVITSRYKTGTYATEFDTGTTLDDVLRSGCKEAGLETEVENNIDFRDIIAEVDAGRPALVVRHLRRSRQAIHEAAKENQRMIPDKKGSARKRSDRREKENWANEDDQTHASIVTGYNKDTREILLTESWGENKRNQRMGLDEFEATVLVFMKFRPRQK